MNKAAKIGVIGTILAAAFFGGRYALKVVKEKAANIDFSVDFSRVHGFMGSGITKFLSPTIRTIFNLTLKNFSGFALSAEKIYTRIEVQTPGSEDWTIIASQTEYINVAVADGATVVKPISVDIKGLASLKSIFNRKNKHRAVITYNFKGVSGNYITNIDVAGKFGAWYDSQRKKIPALPQLSGIEQNSVHSLTCLAH